MSEFKTLTCVQLGSLTLEIKVNLSTAPGTPGFFRYSVDDVDVTREAYFAVLKTMQAGNNQEIIDMLAQIREGFAEVTAKMQQTIDDMAASYRKTVDGLAAIMAKAKGEASTPDAPTS